jgi:uncharacterized protein (DUF362 family)
LDGTLRRRQFLSLIISIFSFIFLGCIDKKEKDDIIQEGVDVANSNVYIIKINDRRRGIQELLQQFDPGVLSGKRIGIKANYNSADPFPASTHIDTLSTIIESLQEHGAEVVLAERSGMGNTGNVLKQTGVSGLAAELDFDIVLLDDRTGSEWVRETGSHWKRGFMFPRVFRDVDAIIQTCCLKTHRYGGHFTMSLKNSVGMVAKFDPEDGYNYMSELHSSRHQRKMIAEINTAYEPEFVIMDALQGFSKGGPDTGTLINPGIMLASKDRVALDAVGVSVLRIYGTTDEVSRGAVFRQDQIARAVELGLGAYGPDSIEVVSLNPEAQEICSRIEMMLKG